MDICIICKLQKTLTDEHIIPEFMGGNLVLYKSVCKDCNSNMGSGFEGRLAKSIIYKTPRFIHQIKGKSKKTPFPFGGVYDHKESCTKFRVEDSGKPIMIPDVKIHDRDGNIHVEINIDESEQHKIKPILIKSLSRYCKSKGIDIENESLINKADKIIENGSSKVNKIQNPMIEEKVTIGVDDLYLINIKIAYELAVFHHGYNYINNEVANNLRICLHKQELLKEIMISSPVEYDVFQPYLTGEFNWVIFIMDYCYIYLFGSSSVIKYISNTSQHLCTEGVVYKFCYKTNTYTTMSIYELLK